MNDLMIVGILSTISGIACYCFIALGIFLPIICILTA